MTFYDHTLKLLEKDEGYHTYDAKNKLLSFYFTYFELLKVNRSFVVHTLTSQKTPLHNIKILEHFRRKYMEYITHVDIKLMDFKADKMEDAIRRGVHEISWTQFLFILKYWIKDTSKNFEQTDILIEKSMNTGFEILNTSPLESILDLRKFVFQDKMKR